MLTGCNAVYNWSVCLMLFGLISLQVIIIVKYFFQFSCFWWLDGDEQSEEPLWLPRLIGIERRDMYAAYDFFLLFCLFLHRMVLKVIAICQSIAFTYHQ